MDEGVTPVELDDKELKEIWEAMYTPILQNQPKTVIKAENYNDNL